MKRWEWRASTICMTVLHKMTGPHALGHHCCLHELLPTLLSYYSLPIRKHNRLVES